MLAAKLIRWDGLSILVLSALLVVTACGTAIARQNQAAPAEFTLELSDAGLTAPGHLPTGIVTIIFKNTGQTGQQPSLVRLNEGVTPEKFLTTMAENPDEAISLAHLLGGVRVAPTTSKQIVYDLKEGDHVVVSFSEAEDTPPLTTVFQVSGQGGAEAAPQSEVKVELQDFAFAMPDQIKAGPQTWQIENTSRQWHELGIVKLNEGATVADILAMMTQEEEPEGPPPFEMIASWGPVSQGERAWATFNLEPGEYTVICGLPDLVGEGHSHLELGMVRSLTVVQ
jgi:hypothetical protein